MEVILNGLVYSCSGFGEALRGFAPALSKQGVRVRLDPQGGDRGNLSSQERIELASLEKTQVSKNAVYIYWGPPSGGVPHNPHYSIIYTLFETDIFPPFVKTCNKMNEVWLTSSFCVDKFKRAGVKRSIHLIPLGIDTDRFAPREKQFHLFPDKFAFGTAIGWSERKGVSLLLRAYLEEFTRKDNVILLIRGGYYSRKKMILEMIKIKNSIKSSDQPDIFLNSQIIDTTQMPFFYNELDCLVYPTRGEGFGLGPIEAMASGVPTIVTRWSGHLDFCNDDNSYLINIDGIGRCPSCEWIHPGYIKAKFANPNLKHLKSLMREVYEDRKGAKKKASQARKDVCEHWTWEHSALKARKRLEEIYAS